MKNEAFSAPRSNSVAVRTELREMIGLDAKQYADAGIYTPEQMQMMDPRHPSAIRWACENFHPVTLDEVMAGMRPYHPYRPGMHPEPLVAVYFLAGRGELLYVGKSNALGKRLMAHWKADLIPFTHAFWIESAEIGPNEVFEAWCIEHLDPPCNKKWTPDMTRWSEALQAPFG